MALRGPSVPTPVAAEAGVLGSGRARVLQPAWRLLLLNPRRLLVASSFCLEGTSLVLASPRPGETGHGVGFGASVASGTGVCSAGQALAGGCCGESH